MNSPQNYGFIYNEFVIDTSRNIIVKRLRHTTHENKDGKTKLQKEIGFYNSLAMHKIPEPFVFPRIYSTSMTGDSHRGALPELHIQYFPDHEPLTERFPYAPASQALIIKVIREIVFPPSTQTARDYKSPIKNTTTLFAWSAMIKL